MDIIFKHTLKSISKNPAQSLVIVVTMIIITVCSFFMLSCTDVFSLNAEIWTESSNGKSDVYSYYFTNRQLANDLVAANPDYVDELLFCTISTASVMLENDTLAAEIIACDADEFLYYLDTESLEEKRNLTDYPSAIIPENLASKHNISVGDKIEISYRYPASDSLVNTFFVSQIVDNSVPFYSQDNYRVMVYEEELGLINSCNNVFIYLKDPDRILDDGRTVTQYYCDYLNGSDISPYTFHVSSSATLRTGTLQDTQRALNLAIAIIILMMFFILFFSYSIVAKSRSQQILIFKAAGATPAQTVAIMLIEVLVYSLIGSAIGIILGKVFTDFISKQIFITTASLLTYSPWKYIVSYLIGIATGLLSCIFPAIRTAKRPVRFLMSGSSRMARPMRVPFVILFSVMLAVFLILVFVTDWTLTALIGMAISGCLWIIGITPYLIRGMCFLVGKIKKTRSSKIATFGMPNNGGIATVTSMLAILIAFMWMGASMINVIKVTQAFAYERYSADFIVVSDIINYDINQTQELLDKYLALDGVTDGCAYSYSSTTAINGIQSTKSAQSPILHIVKGGDAIKYFTTDYDESIIEEFNRTDHPIVVSYELSKNFSLKVGDKVTLTLPNQSISPELTVVGIEHTYSSWAPFAIVKESDFLRSGTNVAIGNKKWFLNGDLSAFASIRNEIDTAYETLYKTDSYYIKDANFDNMNNLLNIILSFFYSVAALGFVNLLIVTILDRKKEIRIFRLTGMTPMDAFRLTSSESLIAVFTGWAVGSAFAIVIAQMQSIFADMMNRYATFSHFPLTMVIISVTVAGVALAAWMISPLLLLRKKKDNSISSHN